MCRLLLVLLLVALPLPAVAHHSVAGVFDPTSDEEIEGDITAVHWQNPHVTLTVRVNDDEWNIELHSVSVLRRMDLTPDLLHVGERVRIAGYLSRKKPNSLFGLHLLLPGRQEVLLQAGLEPRWADEAIGSSDTWFARVGSTSAPERGIFRVWSRSFSLRFDRPVNDDLPLTPTARKMALAFDPAADSPIANCAPKGMPAIMQQPYPIEFLDRGDTIELHIEEYDTVRTIHMTSESSRRAQPAPSLLGYSLGRWDGDTLVVTTTRTNWPHFNTEGVPLSASAVIEERFTPAQNGSLLDYTIRVEDPATFTKAVELQRQWLWLPDARVEPYQCNE